MEKRCYDSTRVYRNDSDYSKDRYSRSLANQVPSLELTGS